MNVILLHSYNADTLDGFAKDIEQYCKENGIEYDAPRFPIREQATYESWEHILKSYHVNEDSVVIAHSLGTQFIIQYLARNEIKIKTYISVAGFCHYCGREDLECILKRFEPTTDEFQRCQYLISNRYALYSNNDGLNAMSKLEEYAEQLHAKKMMLENYAHFSPDDGIYEVLMIRELLNG